MGGTLFLKDGYILNFINNTIVDSESVYRGGGMFIA